MTKLICYVSLFVILIIRVGLHDFSL